MYLIMCLALGKNEIFLKEKNNKYIIAFLSLSNNSLESDKQW